MQAVIVVNTLFLHQPLLLGGLVSGVIEGAAISPFERVKVFLQVQRHKVTQVSLVTLVVYSDVSFELNTYVTIATRDLVCCAYNSKAKWDW